MRRHVALISPLAMLSRHFYYNLPQDWLFPNRPAPSGLPALILFAKQREFVICRAQLA
jgi:hypothetical protein